jgi:hypothetical protein
MNMSRLIRGFQWDLGRQMERLDFLLHWIPRYAEWGYDEMHLYLEDAFDYPSERGVGRKGALSPRQMERLTRSATHCGMKTIPIVPLMGHTAYLMKVPRLLQLAESRDERGNPLQCGQICPLHPGTLRLAERLLRDVAPYCTGGIAHVGLDESFEIGCCPECRKEVERIGLARHFANHVIRLHRICKGLGLRLGMWGDMLYYVPDAIPLLPRDAVVYDWYYYPFRQRPRVELYNFVGVDSTRRLRRAGLNVYGCPNNGPFNKEPLTPFVDRLRNVLSWWDHCRQEKARGILITSWSPTRTSPELNTLVDAAAASLWLEPDIRSPHRMLEQGLRRMWGIRNPSVASLVASVEKYQYAGYYRWQSYDNWRALANGDSVGPLQREEKHFRILHRRARSLRSIPPLAAGLAIRHYLAQKDLYLRAGSELVFQARRSVARHEMAATATCLKRIDSSANDLLKANRLAQRATQILWRRSRPARETNPTETMLKKDRCQLQEIRQFTAGVQRDPRQVWAACPLAGRWQLTFQVRNFEPALQGTVVQMPDKNRQWKTIHTVYSLEFTAKAGSPTADFRRHHAVALDWDESEPLRLRLAVHGFGRLEIYALRLIDGVQTLLPKKFLRSGGQVERVAALQSRGRPGSILGIRAPRKGFPPIDWGADQGWIEVEFYNSRSTS